LTERMRILEKDGSCCISMEEIEQRLRYYHEDIDRFSELMQTDVSADTQPGELHGGVRYVGRTKEDSLHRSSNTLLCYV